MYIIFGWVQSCRGKMHTGWMICTKKIDGTLYTLKLKYKKGQRKEEKS